MKSVKLYDFTTTFLVEGVGGFISFYQHAKTEKEANKEIAKVVSILKPKAIDTQKEDIGLLGFKIPKKTLEAINKSLKTWGDNPKDYLGGNHNENVN